MEKKHFFTPAEKNEFLRIAKKYQSIINIKTNDTPSLQKKNTTWDKIACEYNTSPLSPHPASSKQLRRLWMNIKQRSKRSKSTTKSETDEHSESDYVSDSLEAGDDVDAGSVGEDQTFNIEFIDGSAAEYKEVIREPIATDKEMNQIKKNLLIRDFHERQRKQNELHILQKQLLMERIREARAKANLAELELKQHA